MKYKIILISMIYFKIGLLSPLAKLAPTTFDSIVKESDLIGVGSVDSLTLRKNNSGTAKVSLSQVFKGPERIENIELEWTAEEHDQPIDELGDYLLYLRKSENGNYFATAYGKSYWRVSYTVPGSNKVPFIKYSYPVTLIKILPKERLIQKIINPVPGCEVFEYIDGIYLDSLSNYFKMKLKNQ